MPIKFACQHCRQRLSVSSKRAGMRATCPKCRQQITVPNLQSSAQEEPAADSPTRRVEQPTERNADEQPDAQPVMDPLGEFAVYDAEAEWVYEDEAREAEQRPSPSAVVDHEKVAVPRRILYAQGILLGAVALLCFILGVIVGNLTTRGPTVDAAPQPCTVRGLVEFTDPQNRSAPDDGSVVILVPQDAYPDSSAKIAIDQIAPSASPRVAASARQRLQGIGGNLALVKADGTFELRVPDRGDYYLLVLSRHQPPSTDRQAMRNDVGKVGRYFTPADELLAQFRYAWRRESIRRDKSLAIAF